MDIDETLRFLCYVQGRPEGGGGKGGNLPRAQACEDPQKQNRNKNNININDALQII